MYTERLVVFNYREAKITLGNLSVEFILYLLLASKAGKREFQSVSELTVYYEAQLIRNCTWSRQLGR